MTASRRLLTVLSAAILVMVGAAPANAVASAWFEHEHGAVRLVAAGATAGTDDRLRLGLHFRMKPGWKIYWRSPGDAGFPPQVNWAGSRNFAAAEIAWPAPERFTVLGLQTLGYKDEVLFPIAAEPFEPGAAVDLRARVRFLTCDDICVPYETDLALSLPAGPDVTTPAAGLIDTWRARVPATGPAAPFAIDRSEIAAGKGAATLLVRASAVGGFENPDLFVEGPAGYAFGPPDVQIAAVGDEALFRLAVQAPKGARDGLVGETVTLTLVDGERAAEYRRALSAAAARPAGAGGTAVGVYGFIAILGLAILGGFILNLMPCVLPVLSLKLLSVVSHGGESPARIRAGFLASAAGIVSCFLLLGTLAVGLKTAGLAAGWGIQFQQPAFLAFMIAVLTLFACNMWGMFDIRLPDTVAETAAAAGGSGESGLRGHFLTGAFATLLATPCTAPFLGTAVGFALSRGAAEIYAVFFALGVGLALPWIAVAAFPLLVNRLPRPGRWMITLKRILSIALAGTAAWLLSVLWFQIGAAATLLILMLTGAIAFAIWQHRYLADRARFATWMIVGLLTAISMVGAGSFSGGGSGPAVTGGDGVWRPFDRAAIGREVAAGRVVVVDVTADWCLTCQVNKSLVLERGTVADRLAGRGIVAMRADWTRPDPEIDAYLKSFGRFGIPFNVVYGPAAPQGVPLPEILTEASVLGAIETASGGAPAPGETRPTRTGSVSP